MAYMTFETKQDWKDYQARMDDAMWGIFAKDAPEGGYWELVYFTNFVSRWYDMEADEILNLLEKPYRWYDEYKIYKKFQKVVGETDWYALQSMLIFNFGELDEAMNAPDFKDRYLEALSIRG